MEKERPVVHVRIPEAVPVANWYIYLITMMTEARARARARAHLFTCQTAGNTQFIRQLATAKTRDDN